MMTVVLKRVLSMFVTEGLENTFTKLKTIIQLIHKSIVSSFVALSETLGPNSANVISSKMTSTSRHEKLAINCSNCQTLIMIHIKCRMFYKREFNNCKF